MPELTALRDVVDGPLHEIAARLSRFLVEEWPHTALVIFTRECTGRPRKVAGDTSMINRVTIAELDALKASVAPGAATTTTAAIGGVERTVWVVRDAADTLLVLVPRRPKQPFPRPDVLAGLFGLVATSIRQQVAQASPDYLAESRAASAERARTIAELAAAHEATLVALLSTLRSGALDDAHARRAAADTASAALIELRSTQKSERALSEEDIAAAFARLRKDIREMLRHHESHLDFVAPAAGRAVPGEIAHGARAMTSTAVLAFTAQPGLTRLRIAWSSDATALCADIRDQDSGELDLPTLRRSLDGRARALGAAVDLEAIPGWGSRATITVPLEAALERVEESRLSRLNRREQDVLRLVAQGKRNRAIAAELGITESTVKFHVAGVLRKLEVGSRGEAAALALGAATPLSQPAG